ncbi:prohibitin-2 [Anaeramoeba ignava]|uniref:Prohibitin n=1 Tax=Anaeramoeba ignava TaxID=1746090 RepID=A0A9Q0LVS5_ANAIG|nr:prohibitin-2 [Anaeramoeba ignava]
MSETSQTISNLKKLILTGLGAYITSQSIFRIEPNQNGIVYQEFEFSKLTKLYENIKSTIKKKPQREIEKAHQINRVVGSGIHLKIPFFEKVEKIDITSIPRYVPTTALTKSHQQVNITLHVCSRPIPSKLIPLFQTYGNNFHDRILPSIARNLMISIVSKMKTDDIVQKFDQFKDEIEEKLKREAFKYNLQIDEVSVTHISFSQEYTQAIEKLHTSKINLQISESNKTIAKNQLEMDQWKIRSQSDFISKVGNALKKNPDFLIWKRMDLAGKFSEILLKGKETITANDLMKSFESTKKGIEEFDKLFEIDRKEENSDSKKKK